jgi:hypothetical protein
MALLTDIISITAGLVQTMVGYKETALLLKVEEQSKRFCIWCGSMTLLTLVLLAGIGFILAGVYTLLAAAIGSGLSALIVGIVVSLLAVLLMVIFKSSMR